MAFIGTFNFTNADTGAIKDVLDGFSESFETIASSSGFVGTRVFQVGAHANQTLQAGVGALSLGAMGLRSTLDVTLSPAQAIVSVDRALDYVSGQRAVLGAQASRLEATVANLQTGSESLSASRSRILDADYASETASLARLQILQQAATAMVAQANQLPQGVLALLRG